MAGALVCAAAVAGVILLWPASATDWPNRAKQHATQVGSPRPRESLKPAFR